jgi:hypothetical protein
MINLYLNYYFSENKDRQSEYDYCLDKNLNNPLIDNIFIFISKEDISNFYLQNDKLKLLEMVRPTYAKVIETISEKTSINDVNIIINSDCYIDHDTSNLINHINVDEMWCMNKYDVVDGHFNLKFHDGSCSQDAWIFRGFPKNIQNIDFNFGTPGCDNRFAYESKSSGYILKNPSISLKIIHYHLSQIRTCPHEKWENFRIRGSYQFVEPEKINSIYD